MRLLDLFSGIGGFSLAAQWVWGDELEIVAFCEIDKFCQKVLKNHWPNVPIIEDVRDVKIIQDSIGSINGRSKTEGRQTINGNIGSTGYFRNIDLLTGGFPCQPFSVAGKRKGKEDNRFLWPEMFRVIKEVRPHWVVAENVAGIVRMALDDCLSDLEGEGYSTGTVIIPACAVNAPHRRNRVWIVAHDEKQIDRINSTRKNKGQIQEFRKCCFSTNLANPSIAGEISAQQSGQWHGIEQGSQTVADSNGKHKQELFGRNQLGNEIKEIPFGWSNSPDRRQWESEPDVGRVAHGVPNRVDRLKSLGNAIVPQIAEQIFKAIKEIDNQGKDF